MLFLFNLFFPKINKIYYHLEILENSLFNLIIYYFLNYKTSNKSKIFCLYKIYQLHHNYFINRAIFIREFI